ncbi:LysR family transcriptional regulator [Streptomyces sp. UNOC14_S4]|uniref:LysR family transcriptional regulator n=1 Tax=Streptomyces sp. UNOC14_S4 TaxID=2872340 RepID=UPI001E5D254F|nr:LysR family transcriptional regulator [Streptomyces sp. UNOC14_S4]MCC3766901.1 LysR family transcriptional regulator [Streptomyces sp. UNOC14_S4]
MSAMDVGLRHLRDFLAVSDTLSFTRAAAELDTTQPALSRSIRRLEELMNVRLFDRTTREVCLSSAGVELREKLIDLFPRLKSALLPDGTSAPLRLGFSWLLPDGWLHAAIARFEEETGVAVDLVRQDEPTFGSDRGAVDLAIVRGHWQAGGTHVTRLGEEPYVAAMSSACALSGRDRVTRGELLERPLLMLPGTGVAFEEWAGPRARAASTRCRNFDEWLESVAAGRGVGLVPDLVLRRRLHPLVVFLPVIGPPSAPLALARPVQGAHPLAGRFAELAQEARAAARRGLVPARSSAMAAA